MTDASHLTDSGVEFGPSRCGRVIEQELNRVGDHVAVWCL